VLTVEILIEPERMLYGHPRPRLEPSVDFSLRVDIDDAEPLQHWPRDRPTDRRVSRGKGTYRATRGR
jgi:hypothetical protein